MFDSIGGEFHSFFPVLMQSAAGMPYDRSLPIIKYERGAALKKKHVLIAACSAFLAAIVTFQITVIFMNSNYNRQIENIKAEYSNSLTGKLKILDEQFRELYVGEIDEKELEEAVLDGYISGAGDLYGEYMTAEEYAAFTSDQNGEFQGIGITVTQNTEYSAIEVVSVMPDSPALEAGVERGDLIYMIGTEYVSDLGYNIAVKMLQGEAGTTADFTVRRGENYEEEIFFSVLRGYITEQTVSWHVLDDGIGDIGIIKITSFDAKTPDQFTDAIDSLCLEGVTSLVFDVRDNPGGELTSILSILDMLLPEGPIIRIVGSDGNETVRNSDASEIDMPMAVLINGHTASAAELFSCALQDYDKAVLIGTTTYGKGCMQQIVKLADGSALRVTVSMYNPPFSVNYDGIGVTPDILIEADEKLSSSSVYDIADFDDNQLMAAVSQLRSEE